MTPQPDRRLPRHALKRVYNSLEKNIDQIRRIIPANDGLAETQFLPAALELVETPPSPAGRALLYGICAFFVVALTWATLGKVDLIATASGRIVPSGRVKVIQPLEIGVVSHIDVVDGQAVHRGNALVEIDPTESKAETTRLASELATSEMDAVRLKILASGSSAATGYDQKFAAAIPPGADPALVEREKALLDSAAAQQTAVLAGIDSDMAQKVAERAEMQTEIGKLNETLPLMRKRSAVRQKLIKEGYSSLMEASREQQNLIENEQALVEDRQKLEQSEAAIRQLTAQRQEAVAKFSASTLTDLADAERKADDARQQLVKAQDLASHRLLTAPVDGVVQQLAIHTVGGVVTPAQQLMVVVPKGGAIEVEAMIQNRDIGFVREGQPVEIKLETFPFTRYGLVRGHVQSVSRDAIAQPSGQNGKAAGETTGGAQPAQEATYSARITVDHATMQIDGRTVDLSPGMAVVAEIKTGRQRIIDYLLDPLRRYRHDSFQER